MLTRQRTFGFIKQWKKKGNYHFLLLNRVDAQNKSIASVSGWVYVKAEL